MVIEYKNKLSSLLEINDCHLEDLPTILKELEEKAKTNLASRQTENTPIDTLKRNIEGLFIQMKNVSVFISAQAGTFKKSYLLKIRIITYLKIRILQSPYKVS